MKTSHLLAFSTVLLIGFTASQSVAGECPYSKQQTANKCSSAHETTVAHQEHAATTRFQVKHHEKPNIVEIAAGAENFKTLVAAAKAAGLVDVLQSKGPLTVFAPTDEAFAKLPKGTVETLLKSENKQKLATILKYHVVAGDVRAEQAIGLAKQHKQAKTVAGSEIKLSLNKDALFINESKVIKADLVASNGVIHVIDSVLLPPEPKQEHAGSARNAAPVKAGKTIVETAIANKDFNTLVAAVKAAGLVDTLQGEGPFTVLAPTDKAFAALPKGTVETLLMPENKQKLADILTYHVFSGKARAEDVVKLDSAKSVLGQEVKIVANEKGIMINNAKVVIANIECSNGVIHVIDAVLLPQ
ncbi:MAG: fasciclin domain-containing protein [Lacipirellulaceae bacterium]